MLLIPVLVISLARSKRRSAMSARLDAAGVAFKFFDALDGSAVTAVAGAYYRPLLPGEVGTTASHLATLKMIANGDDEFVCVLEDDVVPTDRFAGALDLDTLHRLPRFDVFRLVSNARRGPTVGKRVVQVGVTEVFAMLRPGDSAAAQIYSRDGARKISAGITVVGQPFDAAMYEETWILGLRVIEARPGIVGLTGEPTTVPGRDTAPARATWRRIVHRLQRDARAVVSYIRAWGIRDLARLRIVRVRS
jgi:GR25 family glycosyltransferase involved in LPS biosynthesis